MLRGLLQGAVLAAHGVGGRHIRLGRLGGHGVRRVGVVCRDGVLGAGREARGGDGVGAWEDKACRPAEAGQPGARRGEHGCGGGWWPMLLEFFCLDVDGGEVEGRMVGWWWLRLLVQSAAFQRARKLSRGRDVAKEYCTSNYPTTSTIYCCRDCVIKIFFSREYTLHRTSSIISTKPPPPYCANTAHSQNATLQTREDNVFSPPHHESTLDARF